MTATTPSATTAKPLKSDFRMALDDLTPNNINQLKRLCSVLLPMRYRESFYRDALASGELSKMAYFNDVPVGFVISRLEKKGGDNPRKEVHVMALGVLAPYRRLGLGRLMIDHIHHQARHREAACVYVHVQTSNHEGREFYEHLSFALSETVPDYYKLHTDVKSAWLLRLPVDAETTAVE